MRHMRGERMACADAGREGRHPRVQGVPGGQVHGDPALYVEEIEAELAPEVHASRPHAEDVGGVGDADGVDVRVARLRLDLDRESSVKN